LLIDKYWNAIGIKMKSEIGFLFFSQKAGLYSFRLEPGFSSHSFGHKKSLKNLRLFIQSAERAGLSSLKLRWAPLRSGSNRGSHPALLGTKKALKT
jgi:hypothetical protein